MRELIHTPQCFANHMGLYLCEPRFLEATVAAIRAGLHPVREAAGRERDGRLFETTGDGVAVIPLGGSMAKGWSKYAGSNTIEVRQAVRAAARDQDVGGILLVVDSPGGMLAGTQELADDVWEARQSKPVHAHIDDLGASAAYWVASQAHRITINRTGEVGSIGVLAVVHDTSKAAEMEGVEVHVVSTGPYKGAFVAGAPIKEAHLADLREQVEQGHAFFLEAVARGRGYDMQKAADGRVYGSAAALELGLVDEIASLDAAHAALAAEVERNDVQRRAASTRADIGRAMLDL